MPPNLMLPRSLKFSCIATLDAFHEGLDSSKFMCLLRLTDIEEITARDLPRWNAPEGREHRSPPCLV
jgi:hypothetical protein